MDAEGRGFEPRQGLIQEFVFLFKVQGVYKVLYIFTLINSPTHFARRGISKSLWIVLSYLPERFKNVRLWVLHICQLCLEQIWEIIDLKNKSC